MTAAELEQLVAELVAAGVTPEELVQTLKPEKERDATSSAEENKNG